MEASNGKKTAGTETEIALRPGTEPPLHADQADSGREEEESSAAVEETAQREHLGSYPGWPVVDWLPVTLNVGLPISSFRVRDLLALEVGTVVATEWPNGDDLPLSAGAVQLAWVDMETVEQEMAVRLTRLL
ncbi:MAG TPA: FliM/FliN family flagellar motor C-terminal domain-containing protein [Acidobacteriaceae bacterium]|nr:FliM/FliN family flagellar motor C-terminal domain-containing protein [Acidobacteriaceae bacterium]